MNNWCIASDLIKAINQSGNIIVTNTIICMANSAVCGFFTYFLNMYWVAFSPAIRPELRAKPSACPLRIAL